MTNQITKVLGKRKKNVEEQTYSRKYDTSPIFPFSNTTEIAVSGEEIVDFESRNRATGKYLPFNSVRVINNSSNDISIAVNQKRDRAILIPAGTIQPIDNTIAPAVSSLIIKNLSTSSTVAIGEINILISKDEVTTDLIAKKMFAFANGKF